MGDLSKLRFNSIRASVLAILALGLVPLASAAPPEGSKQLPVEKNADQRDAISGTPNLGEAQRPQVAPGDRTGGKTTSSPAHASSDDEAGLGEIPPEEPPIHESGLATGDPSAGHSDDETFGTRDDAPLADDAEVDLPPDGDLRVLGEDQADGAVAQ
jgi:hypothetical protein